MLSLPKIPLPARPRRPRSVVAPIALTCTLVATTLVTLVASGGAASAATLGTYTIGDTPVALNQATDPEIGTLTPSADAAKNGMFGTLAGWSIIPLHATLARDGHLITYGTPLNTVKQSGVEFDDWDPSAGFGTAAHTQTAAEGGYNSFCNAAVTLSDGRILMVSGQVVDTDDAEMMSMIYDPVSKQQTMGANLAYQRWYVTALRLTDNRILLLGGAKAGLTGAYATPDDNSQVAYTPEIGTGTGDWTDLTGAASTTLFGATDNHWWYPRAFNSPNGGVVGFSGDAIWTLSADGDGSVQQVGTLPYDPKVSGSQVMYAPGKILIAGGGQVNNGDEAEGTNQAAVLDVNGATPTAVSANPMHYGRNWLNLTVLPTGEVWANGGTKMGTDAGDDNSVKTSELWDVNTGVWSTAATAQMTRTYHSTSVLLPSGAVYTGGGGNPGPVDNFNAELYYPASLFTTAADGTVKWASRPAITTIAGDATYGGSVTLGMSDDRTIRSASLITMPAVTHSQDTDQRRIPLTISQNGSTVTASLPDSVNTMPPGDYELTVVDSKGVPSTAQIVTIQPGQAGLVTVGAGTATGKAQVADPTDTGNPVAVVGGGSTSESSTSTVKLTKGSTVTIDSAAKSGYSLSHSGTTTSLSKAGVRSRSSLKRATSWIVRSGVGSTKGYSFESVDRPGYYLAAPTDGSGALKLVKKTSSSTFKKRATFTLVKGVLGHGTSLRLTLNPSSYLRISGKKAVTGAIGTSSSILKAATFTIRKGLAKRT